MNLIGLLFATAFIFGCATSNPPVVSADAAALSSKLTPDTDEDIKVENATIDKGALRGAIRDSRRNFKKCYDQALKRSPSASGKIVIQWDIEEKGNASLAVVRLNHTGDDEFGQCVKNKIEKIKFPQPPKGQVARVIFPFIFESSGELAK